MKAILIVIIYVGGWGGGEMTSQKVEFNDYDKCQAEALRLEEKDPLAAFCVRTDS